MTKYEIFLISEILVIFIKLSLSRYIGDFGTSGARPKVKIMVVFELIFSKTIFNNFYSLGILTWFKKIRKIKATIIKTRTFSDFWRCTPFFSLTSFYALYLTRVICPPPPPPCRLHTLYRRKQELNPGLCCRVRMDNLSC